jgi:hypothetical protein
LIYVENADETLQKQAAKEQQWEKKLQMNLMAAAAE